MLIKSEVHLIDCMEFMRSVPDNFYSLAVVDPPYGIGASKMQMGNNAKKKWSKGKNWDNETPTDEYWKQLFRVSKNQIVWGGNYFELPLTKSWIVWDKNNGESGFADCELAWTSFNKPMRIKKIHWTGSASNWEDTNGKIHPTQKPIKLYDWIFKNYAKPGDTILDTHMGSQSSRISAYKAGLDYTGCELDPEYFEQGNQRFEDFLKKHGTTDPDKAIPGQQINLF